MPAIARLSSLAARFNRARATFGKAPKSFVGIDIGVREANVVSLAVESQRHRPKRLHWRSLHSIPLEFDSSATMSPAWIESVMDSLASGLPRCVDGENNPAVISFPVPWVHYQVSVGKDLEEASRQCDEMFRASIFQSQAQIGYWPVVGTQHGMPNEDDQYVVAAIASRTACQIAESIANIGYNVQSILPHGVALVQSAKPLTSLDAQCVVMLGRDGGVIAVNHSTGCGLCRTLPALPAQVLDQAADRKLDMHDVRPWLSDVAAEINATLRYSQRANMGQRQALPVLICGDICGIEGLDNVVAQLTGLPVALWRYKSAARPNRRSCQPTPTVPSRSEMASEDERYAAALSLAYLAFVDHDGGSQ